MKQTKCNVVVHHVHIPIKATNASKWVKKQNMYVSPPASVFYPNSADLPRPAFICLVFLCYHYLPLFSISVLIVRPTRLRRRHYCLHLRHCPLSLETLCLIRRLSSISVKPSITIEWLFKVSFPPPFLLSSLSVQQSTQTSLLTISLSLLLVAVLPEVSPWRS